MEFGDNNHGDDHRQDDATLIEEYRAKLQKMYVSHFDTIRSDDIHDALRRYQQGHDHPQEEQHARPPRVEAIDFDFFDEHYLGYAYDNEEWPADIEEECQIPEELKLIPGEMDPLDVMDFLGIRRAEPLRRIREWE